MTTGRSGWKRATGYFGALAAWLWPKVRVLLIVAIAISMAEFVAIDLGMVLAADIMLYVEIVLGTWALALAARLMPGLSLALMLLPSRMAGSVTAPTVEGLEEADELK